MDVESDSFYLSSILVKIREPFPGGKILMKDSFKLVGSDLEEIYFYKLNQELIKKLKEQTEKEKSQSHLKLVSSQDQPESIDLTPKKKAA
jgi:hypothetical protein